MASPERNAKPPILVFEMTWSGTTHAPGNGSTIQTMAAAFPDRDVHFFAEPGHLQEVRRNAVLANDPRVTFHPIAISQLYRGRTGIVAWRRLIRECVTLWRGVRQVAPSGRCLVMLISATCTATFAAAWVARLFPEMAVQVGLHGNLNDMDSRRSRNPAARSLDMRSAVTRDHGPRVRFLVLEPGIRSMLARRDTGAAARTDVLPLPINIAEYQPADAVWPPAPLRVGFVGQATEAKGIGTFLDLAADLRARHGDRIAFHLIGRGMPGMESSVFAPLEEMPTSDHLPREEFIRRLKALHYVLLPFRPGYYDLAASGALIDAVTWLKPVIATRAGFVGDFFAGAGDIGYLCDDAQQMRSRLEALLADPDPARYAAQVAALRAERDRRTPDTLAETYRRIIHSNFPWLT